MSHTPSCAFNSVSRNQKAVITESAKREDFNKPSRRLEDKAASPPLLKIWESPLRQDLSATAAILFREPQRKSREKGFQYSAVQHCWRIHSQNVVYFFSRKSLHCGFANLTHKEKQQNHSVNILLYK